MTEILVFVLGIIIVLLIVGAMLLVKTIKKVEELDSRVNDNIYEAKQNYEFINRRIDQEIDRVNNIYRDSISFTDSRVDKLEAKYLDQTQPKRILKD